MVNDGMALSVLTSDKELKEISWCQRYQNRIIKKIEQVFGRWTSQVQTTDMLENEDPYKYRRMY
jgi:hypothetical protein